MTVDTKQKQAEVRSAPGELRAAGEDGIIEGYATVWGTVDDYGSSFQRGCFAKTLQERGARVKVIWNHDDDVIIGKPIELREDDHGLFVRAQLVLSVARAREVYDLAKAGVVDTFSFAFRTVKDKWVDGVRVITEAMLKEVSPVAFEANSAAVITGVRSMPTEKRAQEYAATYAAYELQQRGSLIINALLRTLDDIWWGSDASKPDEARAKVASALTEFTEMYSLYADDITSRGQRAAAGTALQQEVRKFLSESKQTPEQLSAATSLTLVEVRSLLDGKPQVDPAKVASLPVALSAAIQAERNAKIEALFNELRSGFLPAELSRLRGLLPPEVEDPHAASVRAVSKMISDMRSGFVTQR